MSVPLVSLVIFFLIALGLAAFARSWAARIVIVILVPVFGTAVVFSVLIELLMHGYFGGL